MQLQTPVALPFASSPIGYEDKILLMGSCFAENIGAKLVANKFRTDVNPFGVLYNPLSLKSALNDLLQDRIFTADDLFEHQGIYRSFSHHSSFSSDKKETTLHEINERAKQSSAWLKSCTQLIVTFGTASTYYLKENEIVVSNCHKLPESQFIRKRVDVEIVVSEWCSLINNLKCSNPDLKILFTVSPIRHWRDGAHENQLNKATLLLAIDKLVAEFDFCSYFAAYELVMDELRDYRFYAEDMIHPSDQAVDYIWECFCESQISEESRLIMKEWIDLQKALFHRPFHPQTETHKRFLEQNLTKLEQLSKKSPYFVLESEITLIREQLQSFESL
ncbi:MAG: GSCFA domain-containing protein [Bacteroidales bacterium]